MAAEGDGAVSLGKAEERKERVVHARFGICELAAIEQAARAAGLTVSGFMRSLAIEGAGVRPFLTDDDRAVFEMLISDMRVIGVNLNQLARAVNGSGRLAEAKLAAELIEVQRLAAAIVLELRSLAGRGARRHRGAA